MSITFSPGTTINAPCTFSLFALSGSARSFILEVNKQETAQRIYKLGISFLGLDASDRPKWVIYIDDQRPVFSTVPLAYHGSKKLALQPEGSDALTIEETDENQTEKLWVDLSGARYTVGLSSLVSCDKIKALVGKAKIFKPEDGKAVSKIFFSRSAGVIIYAKDTSDNKDIYHAKEGDDFIKTDSRLVSQCRCPQSDSKWEITLPDQEKPHVLKFSLADIFGLRIADVPAYGAPGRIAIFSTGGHGKETSWDGEVLNQA